MKRIKLSTVAAGTAALLVAGLAVGYGAGTATASPRHSGVSGRSALARTAEPASATSATAAAVPHATVLDGTTTSTLTPITSCRVVDTRSGGGRMANNVPRDFQIGGTTGFTGQGGRANGCGIPTGATAVTGTITMVSAGSNGYIHLYPQGTTDPGASFLNFAKSFNVSGSGLFTLGSTGAVTMKVLGATSDVVIDLTGYYLPPMDGFVSDDGSLVYASRITAVTHQSTGIYEVSFDRDVSSCTFYVTSEDPSTTVSALNAARNKQTVYVELKNLSNDDQDHDFYIQATC